MYIKVLLQITVTTIALASNSSPPLNIHPFLLAI